MGGANNSFELSSYRLTTSVRYKLLYLACLILSWLGGWVGGWGQSDIKDHPSPAEARVGAELGNNADDDVNQIVELYVVPSLLISDFKYTIEIMSASY